MDKTRTYQKAVQAVLTSGLIVLGLGWTQKAHAINGSTDTITVTVTPDVQYSVQITSPELQGYDFGLVRVGATTISTLSIAVKNSGDISEYFSMAVNDNSGGNSWTNNGASLAPGTTSYVMQGFFVATPTPQPANSSFNGAAQNIPTSPPTTATNKFGQTGGKTAAGDSQYLWLRLHMPTAVNDSSQHSLVLSINGQSS
jgi:hypothetical protein